MHFIETIEQCDYVPVVNVTRDLLDVLFFIQYTPKGTMLRCWCLIQVDMKSIMILNKQYASDHTDWCVF